jgi:glutaredoxin-like YruB-family protein
MNMRANATAAAPKRPVPCAAIIMARRMCAKNAAAANHRCGKSLIYTRRVADNFCVYPRLDPRKSASTTMEVIMYSTKTCPYCKMEKEYLDSKGLKYTNFSVDEDEKKVEEMIKKSGQMGVPVTVITDDAGKENIVVGFDKKQLDKLLSL